MAGGITKGIGEQFEQLGKQVATEIIKTPAKLTGFDTGTNESSGQGSGKHQSGGHKTQQQNKSSTENIDPLANLKQKAEIEKQQKLAAARRRLQELMKGVENPQKTLEQQRSEEEMMKKQQEVAQREKAAQTLPQSSGKRKRGDLYGISAKRFAGEKNKNTIAQ